MTGTGNCPQQQQQLQQAEQQRQMLCAVQPSAAEARVLFLHDELCRMLTEQGFTVHKGRTDRDHEVPRGISVRIDGGVILIETDERFGEFRSHESFKVVPQEGEGAPRYILGRYQIPTFGGLDIEPGYFRTRNEPFTLSDGLPPEIRGLLAGPKSQRN